MTMTTNELVSALRTLLADCPQYGDVPVLVEVMGADGERDLMGVGFHLSDGIGDEDPPKRLLLTVVDQNYEDGMLPFVGEGDRETKFKFNPNTQLYGRAIKVHAVDLNGDEEGEVLGTLIEIKSPHSFLIETEPGERKVWEVDASDDFVVGEDLLELWNAWS